MSNESINQSINLLSFFSTTAFNACPGGISGGRRRRRRKVNRGGPEEGVAVEDQGEGW